jgi:GNAT superfamily N-acetyltransferase
VALNIEVKLLEENNLDPFLAFVEGPAFADNPHWRSCYCVFHYLRDASSGEWHGRSAADNKGELCSRVQGGGGRWLVAYYEERVVGWVNADERRVLQRYDEWEAPQRDKCGVVACFVVDPQFRRQGVATQLLSAAVEDLRQRGASTVEAYIVFDPEAAARSSEEGLGADQMAHHGPLAMYEAAGFRVTEHQGPIAHLELTLS